MTPLRKKSKNDADVLLESILHSLPEPPAFPTRGKWMYHAWRQLTQQLHAIKSPRTFEKVLSALVSIPEQLIIVRRATALRLLRRGASYRAIGRRLWISPHTISALKKAASTYRYVSRWPRTKKLYEEKLAREFKKEWEKRNAPTGYYRRTKYGRRWTSS